MIEFYRSEFYIFISVFGILVAILIFFIFGKNKKLEILKFQNLELKVEKDFLEKANYELKLEFEKQSDKNRQDYIFSIETLKKEYEKQTKIANETLINQNKLMFNENGKDIMNEVFNPLKEKIDEYQKNILNFHEKLAKNEIETKTNIDNILKYTNEIGGHVTNFAKVLKGDIKIRGDFGELQLKSVLENSGLNEGEHYKIQESFKQDGKFYRPDVVVSLDKNRSVVIDAKFSLPSDLKFQEIDDSVRKELANNVKSRIDELSSKEYQRLDESIFEFIIMFIPYQNILELALMANPNLYKYAYEKNILLATPYTLFITLKSINLTWISINQEQNAKKMVCDMSLILDKFTEIIKTFSEVKKQNQTLNQSIEKLDKQLLSGRGNLTSKGNEFAGKYGFGFNKHGVKFEDGKEIV